MRDKSAKNFDQAIDTLLRLKGMFGAMIYLINPDGTRTGAPSEDFESWFIDIRNKLEHAVELLCET